MRAHRFEVYDRVVGHDRVVSFHQIQLAAAVGGRFVQTVDGAALGAGADGHAGDGLIAANTVHRPCPTSTRFELLDSETTGRETRTDKRASYFSAHCRMQ